MMGYILATLVAFLPFEFRAFPVISNLQWLFLLAAVAALPLLLEKRTLLLRDPLVRAGMIFMATQWLAAVFAPEFTANATKGALRVTAGLVLFCVVRLYSERGKLLRIWALASVVAAVYALIDFGGFGWPRLFREVEFWYGPAMRLSGSFEYPNTAAAYFAMSLPLVWSEFKSQRVRVTLSLLLWIVLLLTYSRGAVAAAAIALLAWAFMGRVKTLLPLAGLAAASFVVLALLVPSLVDRLRAPFPERPLSAAYEPEFNVLKRAPNQQYELSVRIRNSGTTAWNSKTGKPFTLSYWWDAVDNRKHVDLRPVFIPLADSVEPGQTVTLLAPFVTPDQPGHYLLAWDISRSGSDWFSGIGIVPGLVEVDVQQGIPEQSGHGDLSRWQDREFSRLFVANVPFSRLELWDAALRLIREHPLTGSGPDNFRLLYGRPFGLTHWDVAIRSNNLYLEILSGSGIVGLAAFLVLVFAVRRELTPQFLAIGVFLLHGVVDVFLMTTPIYFAFWILLAETGSRHQVPKTKAPR